MKIWYQSSAPLGIDPKWDPYQESLKRHVQKVARPDTKVDIHGAHLSHPLLERSRYVGYLHQAQIIDNAIQAEGEGYDAFCVACTLDPGFFEIREVVSIPVAFLSESCFHLASILADKFSLLAHSENTMAMLRQKIRQYGLQERFIPPNTFNLSLLDIIKGFKNPAPIVSIVKEAGRKTIEQGAGILLPACNILNMVLVDADLREINGAPILDTAGAMVKVTEFMVDLDRVGISRSRTGVYTPLSDEEVASIRNLFGVEQKRGRRI